MNALAALTEATWPPAARRQAGPWTIRDGQGGGQRVSATTASGAWTEADIALAEAEMAALGQPMLFQIWPDDARLDAALEARGYRRHDPVIAYAAEVAELADPDLPPLAAFTHWPPLGIASALWDEAGIGPARRAVMERVAGPKTVILGRTGDRAAGAAFVARGGDAAMLHALEVVPSLRRQGTAHNILRAAANWAQDQGVARLFLLVTEANENARHLYASLRMQPVESYHYRLK